MLLGTERCDLPRPCGTQSESPSSRLELVRGGSTLPFKSQPLVLFQQFLALATQALVFVTKLHRGEVLLGRKQKPASQHQSTKQQQRESRQRGRVASATNLCVQLILRKSFHMDAWS